MDRCWTRLVCWQIFPNLIRGEHEQRGKHTRQRVCDLVKRGLRRTPCEAAWRVGIKPILQDVEISRRKRDGAEVIERVVNSVKFISCIGFANRAHYSVKLSQRPVVSFKQLLEGYPIPSRI